MGSWEEIAIGWTSLGVLKLMETAASVPAWEYFSLVSLLTLAWLYCILDFHFMSALRGDAIRLFYNHESKIQCQILQHCRVLKERYYTTLWLSSPHLQTCFLYFNGRPPPIKYDRQLYITADGGTIALDWVMSPLATDKVGITSAPQSSASDETPMIVIIPGLTSDSNDSVSLGHKIVHCHSLDKLTDITTSVMQQFSQVLFFWRYSAIVTFFGNSM